MPTHCDRPGRTTRTPLLRVATQAIALTVALTATLCAMPAGAAPEPAFLSAYGEFNRASLGDASAVEPAADAFASLLRQEPGNPVLMAYAGASTAMRATTTWLPMKKMGYAEDGLALIDKSLAMLTAAHDAPLQHGTPAVLEVRFVAANTYLAVPGFMNRAARGAKLLDEVLGSPLFDAAPLAFRGMVWMRAATLARKEQRADDERRYLSAVVGHHAPQSAQAQALMKGPTP